MSSSSTTATPTPAYPEIVIYNIVRTITNTSFAMNMIAELKACHRN
jgi:hypothetical protein